MVSLACGISPQYIAARYPDLWVIPAKNTTFAGGSAEHGGWEHFRGQCILPPGRGGVPARLVAEFRGPRGQCLLHLTGGICPVIRCPKSILNGPCGGSQHGKCEIGKDADCAWHLIHEKLKSLGRLNLMRAYQGPKDWSKVRDGRLRW